MNSLGVIFLTIVGELLHTAASQLLPEVDVSQIPEALRTYNFDPESRCNLLAHDSCIVENKDHNVLVVDGGFGTFQTVLNGQRVSVPDLNPYTVAFDLSKNFTTTDLEPLWSYKKPVSSSEKNTIVNHGGIWLSDDGNKIWTQGGHFYHAERWLNSSYSVPKNEIPPWELWEMDVTQHGSGWKNVVDDLSITGDGAPNRTFAGAAASANGMHYWVGGIFDSTTSPATPNDTLETTTQMLIYSESKKTIQRAKYYDSPMDGYFQGTLIHLDIGKSGYLLSLMSLKRLANLPWADPDGESGNIELATPVDLDTVPIYDIANEKWIEQRTAWFMDQIPQPRTRFCAALFRSADNQTWDIWMHGGQRLDDQSQGVEEIYVLSMPSFIWTKVETTLPATNLIRSHTCHALGGQLLIVGGYPTGLYVETNVTCDPEYVKVLNIGEDSIAWTGAYHTNTVYKTPQSIRNVLGNRTTPYYDFASSQLRDDFAEAMSSSPVSSKKSIPVAAVAGGVVGGVVLLAGIGLAVWFFKFRNRSARKGKDTSEDFPRSPQCEQPEVVKNDVHSSTRFVAVARRPTNELEGSSPT